jgi:hypothetical protein
MFTAKGECPSTTFLDDEQQLRSIMLRDGKVVRDRDAREDLRVFTERDELRGHHARKSLASSPSRNKRETPS